MRFLGRAALAATALGAWIAVAGATAESPGADGEWRSLADSKLDPFAGAAR